VFLRFGLNIAVGDRQRFQGESGWENHFLRHFIF